jgi:predicted O-methyltransferase YrrM
VDNALWGGKVANLAEVDADTVAIRELNAYAAKDPRVSVSLVPIGDGLLLVRKK